MDDLKFTDHALMAKQSIERMQSEIMAEQANSAILRQRLVDLVELAMNGERCELLSIAQAIIESDGAPIHDKL